MQQCRWYILLLIFTVSTWSWGQADSIAEPLPFYQIPEAPQTYTAASVAARMVDGLGFRYHWATDGLRTEDLDYDHGNDARTVRQTLEHLYNLAGTILNSASSTPNVRPLPAEELTFDQLRQRTLERLQRASDRFHRSDAGADMDRHSIIFQRGEQTATYPFWNQLNGPLADAIWHTGQIVALRRISGNPIDPRVNVFIGKLVE